MRLPLLLTAAAPLVLLAACASAPGSGPAPKPNDVAAGVSSYGMFLAGESALNNGKSGDAAKFFDKARIETGDPMISERAFTAALLAGDIGRAAVLAPTGDDASEASKRLGKLVVAVEDMAAGKGKDAKTLLANDSIAFPHKSAAALLAPWAAAEAGDVDGSLVRPQVRGDRLVDYFGQLGQATLYERAKRNDEAETDFKALVSLTNPTEMAVISYGAFLERRGRRVDALALYEEQLGREPGSIAVKAAKARASAGKTTPAMLTIREGAAQALLAPSATMIAAKQTQLSLAYLRLVLRLDPQRDEAWVMVGDLMQGAGDSESARAAYGRPKPGSVEYATAQAKLAWTYQAADDKETALKLARTAAASGDNDARVTLADLLRARRIGGCSIRAASPMSG